MTDILTQLRDKARERASKWSPVSLVELPDPFQLNERTSLGSYSYALQVSRVRLLRKYSLINLGEGVKETPSSIARDYLKLAYKYGPKILHEQAIEIGAYDDPEEQDIRKRKLKPYPLFAKPARFDHGFYIDIHSTFWAIMLIAGWNVDYYPKQWLAGGRPPDDFPFPKHKAARSCLVSVARPGKITFYEPVGKFPEVKAGMPTVNLSISKLISDILNSIASEAVAMGAVYANTDGYILPTERQAAHVAQMVFDWGLEPRIKYEGPGAVKGVGGYKVGDYESEPYKSRTSPEPLENLYPPDYKKWLQFRFSKLSASCKKRL